VDVPALGSGAICVAEVAAGGASGHTSVPHSLLSSVSGHTAPAPCAGIKIDLVRFVAPPSHDLEQACQVCHCAVLQSKAFIVGGTVGERLGLPEGSNEGLSVGHVERY
jgi:hypothetical protein